MIFFEFTNILNAFLSIMLKIRINDSKLKQAIKYFKERGWEWRIITEKEINIY